MVKASAKMGCPVPASDSRFGRGNRCFRSLLGQALTHLPVSGDFAMPATDAVPQGKSDIRQTTSQAPFPTEPGRPHPLGATVDKEGVNFSVFSRNATTVELLLFERQDDVQPIQIIKLDPPNHQTFFFWHVYVKGLRPGAHYAYRVDGPQDLDGIGFRFNRNKVLVDPYALGNTKALFHRDDAVGPADNLATSMRSVVIDHHDYDWEGDQLLRRPIQDLIIYEMHVAGFTRHCIVRSEAP